MFKPRLDRMSLGFAAIFAGLAADLAKADKLERINSARTGRGRVTVFTHHNYINDPRRKWYGLGGRYP